MRKEDKRSRKTIKAIQDALLRMLAEKRLSDIKIVDLCKNADINRTTFYLHFESTEQVLLSIREEIVKRIFDSYKGNSFFYTLEHPLGFLTTCTEVISSYDGFENFVRNSSEAAYFLEKLKKCFAARAYADFVNENAGSDDHAFYIIDFMTAGMLDVFSAWLRSEQETPLESILDKCAKLLSAGHEALTDR